MTGTPQNPESQDDLPLVAEYVLGLLDAAEHERLAARIATEPALQRELVFWQQKFSRFDDQFAETAPPAHVFGRIERRLFAENARTGFWNSLAVWRGLAAGALGVAVIAVGIAVWPVMLPGGGPVGQQMAATLSAKDSVVRFLAVYDGTSGTMRLAGLSGAPVTGKDYELWFIKGKAAPVSLGVVPVDARTELTLPASLRAQMGPDVTLAVTLEPKGGAPDGKPTGPLVAAGPVTAV